MSSVAERLAAAGMMLPVVATPAGSYVPAIRAGELVFTSGQLPVQQGSLVATGLVGASVSPEIAKACAAVCALNALAAASSVCDLDDVEAVVKLVCYVASADGFTAQPGVADGASSVIAVAFESAGLHAREAVGVAQLPLGAPVEVSVTLKLR